MDDKTGSVISRTLTRRGVLALAGASVVTVVLASCRPEPEEPDYAIELNALLSQAAQGDRVVLPSGSRTVRSTVRLRSGVELAAHPDGSTLTLADHTDSPFVLANGISGARLTNVTFDGGTQSVDAVSLQIDASSDMVVSGCGFVRMKHAVHVYAASGATSERITVVGCTFDQITDFAVRIDAQAQHIEVTGNTVSTVAKGTAPSPSAIYVRGRDVVVRGNVVLSSYDTGVMVAGDDARDVTVEANTLSTDMVSIYFGNGARSGTVSKNTVTSQRDFGVHVHDRAGGPVDLTVTGNTIGPTGKTGVQIEGVQRVTLTDNNIHDVAQQDGNPDYWRCGVAVTEIRDEGARSVLIEDNDITGQAGKMVYGVLIMAGTSNVIVKSNTVSGAIDASYQVASSGGPYLVERENGSVVARKGVTRKW